MMYFFCNEILQGSILLIYFLSKIYYVCVSMIYIHRKYQKFDISEIFMLQMHIIDIVNKSFPCDLCLFPPACLCPLLRLHSFILSISTFAISSIPISPSFSVSLPLYLFIITITNVYY